MTLLSKGTFYQTKTEAISAWLVLALQDSEEGLYIPPEELIEDPLKAIDIAQKVCSGEYPFASQYRAINVKASIHSFSCEMGGKCHLSLRWDGVWTKNRFIEWHIPLFPKDIEAKGYFDSGTGEFSTFINHILKNCPKFPLDGHALQ